MKKFLLASMLLPVALSAQRADSMYNDDDSAGAKKCIRVVSIGAYSGGDIYRDGFEDRTIFQQAVPSSALAYSDLTGFSNQSGYYMPYMMNAGNVSEGMFVNMQLRCQHRWSELRAGIVHTNVNVASQFYYRSTTTTIDTTTLPGGETMYTDSMNYAFYQYNWNSDMIGLHVGWIVRTSPRRLFSLYTGIGLSASFGFNGIYTAHYTNYSVNQYRTADPNTNISYSSQTNEIAHIDEAYKAPGFSAYSVYLPIGGNLRLSRRQNFFGHTALFFEYQGAMQFIMPSGMNSKIRTSSTFAGGLRWYVRAPKSMHEGRSHRHHRDWPNDSNNQNRKVD